MRTVSRTRDPDRESHLSVVVAVTDEEVSSGDIVMLQDVGACLVLSADEMGPDGMDAASNERRLRLEVEAFAFGNSAPDLP